MALPLASPRIEVSSSSVSKTRPPPASCHEALRHAVHAAFHRDVLAEHQHVGLAFEHGRKRGVDGLRERQRLGVVGRRHQRAGQPFDLFRPPNGERAHDVGGCRELLGIGQLAGDLVHQCRRSRRVAERDRIGVQPVASRCCGGAENRIAFGVGAHLDGCPIRAFDIGAGMSTEPHSSQVQERGLAGAAHPLGQVGCDLGDRNRIVAVDGDVAQVRARRERRLDPTRRCAHADPEPVVLADEHQRQRQPLVRAVRGGVERCRGDGVIGGRIAEAAHRDRVARPWRLHLQLRRPDRWRTQHRQLAAGARRWSMSAE